MAGAKRSRAVDVSDNDSEGGIIEDDGPKQKKTKPKTKATPTKATKEDTFFELGNKSKRVTVNSFNGKTLIHIREYYEDKNTQEMKPGKKGIALTMEHYNALLAHIPKINRALQDKGEDVGEAADSDSNGDPVAKDEPEKNKPSQRQVSKTAKANIEATDSEDD